ncbi:hypothetical protein RJ53_06325 [Methanocalculus chunghsingensis]|uniref:KEOPS complex subunit Cgi121 n=1 Tax=Methanocalculus chunghsingensis TaxID=156457 RepID=A0A8J8B4W4_9EURY|nr:KEOPS complex subunit Cgi121 [Methanocalculus chunghsingensis]MBR1369131.1 hypothetical protein [Methanocalculus chunghsingensis]
MNDDFQIRMAQIRVDSVPGVLHAIREIAESLDLRIICMNAGKMAGYRHAEKAVRHALRAEKEGGMTARSLEMEALLYVSGQRQTGIGMNFGLTEGEMTAWVVLLPASDDGWKKLSGIMVFIQEEEGVPDERIPVLKDLYGITDEELGVVGRDRIDELVIERTALLEILK